VLAKRLQHERFHRILSSDLLRAVQTAELVAAAQQLAADGDGTNGSSSKDSKAGTASAAAGEGAAAAAAAVETDPSLRERCLGALQGLTLAQAAQQQPLAYAALHTRSHSGAPPRVSGACPHTRAWWPALWCDITATLPLAAARETGPAWAVL
jgi:broad specificity phosphatase PhoE